MIVETEKTADFPPVKIALTLESEEEVIMLWHRLNLPIPTVKDYYQTRTHPGLEKITNLKIYNLFTVIDDIRTKRSIKL